MPGLTAPKKARKLPTICLDEHAHPGIGVVMRRNFHVIETAHSDRFKGRDEADYIAELYRENAIFLTSDGAFVNEVLDNNIRHAGPIFVPTQMTPGEKTLYADILGRFILGACRATSRLTFQGTVFYPGHDGLRTIKSRTDEMEFSWDWLSDLLGCSPD